MHLQRLNSIANVTRDERQSPVTRHTHGRYVLLRLAALLMMCIVGSAHLARAQTEYFSVTLNGASTVPPSGSAANGLGFLSLDTASNMVSYRLQYASLGSNEVGAHIHGAAPAGVNAGVLFVLPLGTFKSGTLMLTASQVGNLRAGLLYIDIHSSNFAGGEIRGQVLPQRYAFGLPNTPVGQAQLSTGPSGDLVVGNTGAGGQDGIALSLGKGEGMHLTLSLPPDPMIPVGARLTYQCIAEVPGQPDLVVMEQRTERTATGFSITPDFSGSGSPTYSLKLFRAGVLVYQRSGASGVAAQVATLGATPGICEHPSDTSRNTTQETALTNWDVGGGVTVLADASLAGADAPIALPPTTTFRIELRSTIPSSFSITKEWLIFFGQAHESLGSAHMLATPGQLAVSALSAAATEGIRLNFDVLADLFGFADTRGLRVDITPFTLTVNDLFRVSATGVLSGSPGAVLGQAEVRNNGGVVECSVDFSPIGATQVRIDVYSSGAFVGTTTVPTGVIGTLSGAAAISVHGCGKHAPDTAPPCFIVWTDPNVTLTPTLGVPRTGDEFRFLAANASGTIDRLSLYDIVATSSSGQKLVIVGESAVLLPPGEPFCFGDGTSTPCPCGNSGGPGNGCASSFNPAGANLDATGSVADDNVVLHGSGMNAAGTAIFLKGSAIDPLGFVFGDGITCVAGSLIRLRAVGLSSGAASFPGATETVSLSVRGGTPVGSGLTAPYGVYYRNASAPFCPPATFNVTNSYRVTW